MDNSDFHKALLKNWASPFVSSSDDGTELAINEHHLYFVRQLREPVPMITLSSGADFFRRIISGTWDSDNK
jgi:hypothetical protein